MFQSGGSSPGFQIISLSSYTLICIGELPPDWNIARLTGKHPSQPYNPDVANAFFRAGMIEAWGRGIERILLACRAAGTPRPKVRFDHGGLWVVFPYQADKETILSNTQGKNSGKAAQMVSRPESRLESRLESKLAARVILQLNATALGKLALAQGLGHQSVSGELNKQIHRLQGSGLIEYTIPDKPNSRLQQYRLTDKGRSLLK